MGDGIFIGCTSLESVTILAETPPEMEYGINNNSFDNTNNYPIYVPEQSVEAYKEKMPRYVDRIQQIPQP